MNFLKDIFQRCHQRHKKPIQQKKTIATPAIFRRSYTCQYTAYCARNYPVLIDDLEHAGISFMPIGLAPKHENGAQGLAVGSRRFTRRFGIEDWKPQRWEQSWGIQIYTGIPSERDGARWHDIEFKYEAICAAPDAVLACIEVIVDAVANPLLTLTKSGGLRFSCRIQDYLHPGTQEERLYIYKHTPTRDNPCHRDVYLEIFGDKGYNRWDARYEILLGNMLDPPLIPKSALFTPLDTLRAELHAPAPDNVIQAYATNTPLLLGSDNLNLAKEDLLKRGFTYLRQENGLHYWTRPGGDVNNTDVVLLEHDNTVMIRTATPDAGLPMQATPVTEVWSDTKIVPPMSTPAVSDKMRSVRKGTLSPLAVKRPKPVLRKTDTTEAEQTELEDRFQKCSVSKDVLTEWAVNWRGEALGNFASALLNALEIRGEPHNAVVKRIRTVIQAFQPQVAEIIKHEPVSVFWEQINRFFEHYTRNADAPIRLDNATLTFYIPKLNLKQKRLMTTPQPPWQAGNSVFQIRTGLYPRGVILDYRDTWQVIGISDIGHRFFAGIRAEVERDPAKHVIISDWLILQKLQKIVTSDNVYFVSCTGEKTGDNSDIERADVIWIVGMPYNEIGGVWERAQILFGNDDQPLCYDRELNAYHFKDERVQSVYEEAAVRIVTQLFGLAQLNHTTGKKVMLLTGLELPNITDRSETLLFDWEDFEVAGKLDKLPEVIETRQRFETERDNLTAESSRKEVERVLGCSSRQANRFLQKLRGGNLQRVPFREQILSLLADGEKTTAELIEDIEGNPEAVKHELTRLVNADKIVRIRHGVYRSQ